MQTSYITDSDGLVHTAVGWVSTTDTDVLYYDGSTYRNSLNAGYIGGPLTNDINALNTDFKTADDVFNATAPWPKQKTITYRNWVDGSGNVLASVPHVAQPRVSGAIPFYAS